MGAIPIWGGIEFFFVYLRRAEIKIFFTLGTLQRKVFCWGQSGYKPQFPRPPLWIRRCLG